MLCEVSQRFLRHFILTATTRVSTHRKSFLPPPFNPTFQNGKLSSPRSLQPFPMKGGGGEKSLIQVGFGRAPSRPACPATLTEAARYGPNAFRRARPRPESNGNGQRRRTSHCPMPNRRVKSKEQRPKALAGPHQSWGYAAAVGLAPSLVGPSPFYPVVLRGRPGNG